MSTKKITADVLEGFLHCPTKTHLKPAADDAGTRPDDEAMLLFRFRDSQRTNAIDAVKDAS